MKEIRIPLEDAEHKLLTKIKGNMTWRELLFKGGEINGKGNNTKK